MSGQPLAVIRPTPRPVAQPTPPQGSKTEVGRTIDEFQLDTTEIDTRPEPMAARATLLLMAAAMIVAVLWASFAHIDRVVSARGKVVSTAANIVVQPLEAAIIRSIDVKVGDVVKAGAVLAKLDPTFAQADLEQIEARIASLDAVIGRLEAEQHDRPYEAQAVEGNRSDYGMLQSAIWNERRTEFAAQMRLFDQRLARATASLLAREQERGFLSSRLKILREVEAMRVELESAKTGSRLNSLIARDGRIEVERNLTRAETGMIEVRHEIDGIKAERDVYRRQWESKVVEELVTRRNERDGLIEQLAKARRRQEMVQLTTPVDAVVLEVAPRSVGSIIQDAEALFRLVPLDAPLEIEAQIDAREIGRVVVGDPVQIKIDAYTYQEHGTAKGVVRVLSSDAFVESRPVQDTPTGAYYKARIALSEVNLRNVPNNFSLLPGLPLSAEIKVGDRSIMSYFLRPILRGLNESMREP